MSQAHEILAEALSGLMISISVNLGVWLLMYWRKWGPYSE